MTASLYLQEERRLPDEPGLGLVYDLAPAGADGIHDAFRRGTLTTLSVPGEPGSPWATHTTAFPTAFYNPIAGHLCGMPDLALAGMDVGAWQVPAGTWRFGSSFFNQPLVPGDPLIAVPTLDQLAAGAWVMEASGASPAGRGRFLRFFAYENTADLVLTFGGVWRLHLLADGQALLERWDGTAYQGVAAFGWMAASRFAPAEHWLWIYQAQARLNILNLATVPDGTPTGQAVGVSVYDETAPYGDPVDGHPPARYALRPGKWRLTGSGYLTVSISDQQWRPGWSRFARTRPATLTHGAESTRELRAAIYGLASHNQPVGPTPPGGDGRPWLRTFDENGHDWPVALDPAAPGSTTPRQAVGFDLRWDSGADGTWFLSGFALQVPRTTRLDGQIGTDVLAQPDVAGRLVGLTREDPTRERLVADLFAYRSGLASHVLPNLAVRYEVDGVTRFRGLTDAAAWDEVTDTVPPTGRLRLEAQGLWKRFRKALWPGGRPFDGRLLHECVAEVLDAAGLEPDDYDLAELALVLPTSREGDGPALVYRPGESLDRILEDLQRKFYGRFIAHGFRPSDGRFVLAGWGPALAREPGPPTPDANGETGVLPAVAAAFFDTHGASVWAGAPGNVILDGSYAVTLDESDLYNAVTVAGETPDGELLLARAVDWASVRDPAALNYVGEFWQLIVIDPSLAVQEAVEYVCRGLYERHRLPRVEVSWTSQRVDVWPGDTVALYGANHPSEGTLVSLTAVGLEQAAAGDAADPAGRASYRGEWLRSAG